jgi:hypothetical protein
MNDISHQRAAEVNLLRSSEAMLLSSFDCKTQGI